MVIASGPPPGQEVLSEGLPPVVSVVMPVHARDDAGFLREALESIALQSLTDLECIVVADGPVGGDVDAVLGSFVQSDGRFRAVRLESNRGPGAARNAGIAHVSGRYVALLDADDIAEPERLARQRDHLERGGADFVGSWYTRIDERGRPFAVKRLPQRDASMRRWMPLINPIANSTVLAKAEILREHPFREDYRYGEDYDLWVRLARAGVRLQNLPEPLVRLRVGPGFLDRRTGWARFRTDLANKTRATALWAVWIRPLIWPIALLSSLCRLLPAPALGAVYRVRNRLRFGGD